MYEQKFTEAINKVTTINKNGIGTLNEHTLHAILKCYYEPNQLKTEVKVGSYYADIFNENGIIEIQTRNLGSLKRKLEFFLQEHRVTIVYPIASKKWLTWIDTETGETTTPRKSPKNGRCYDVFRELYSIKPLLNNKNLSLILVFLEIDEYRYLNGWSKDKKRGSVRLDRIPKNMTDEITLSCENDYKKLIPPQLPSPFTTKDFKACARIPIRHAQSAVNVLSHIGVIEKVGKVKNAFTYRIKLTP